MCDQVTATVVLEAMHYVSAVRDARAQNEEKWYADKLVELRLRFLCDAVDLYRAHEPPTSAPLRRQSKSEV
jgi:hypothetical protein